MQQVTRRMLIVISISTFLLYFYVAGLDAGLMRSVIKTLPVATLALIAFLSTTGATRISLTAALALGSLGDALLSLPGAGYFEAGLGAFLLGHLCYIRLFLHQLRPRPWPRAVTLGVVALAGISAVTLVWLALALGALAIPIGLYTVVITAMAMLAIVSRLPPALVVTGALLFAASDGMIALNRFADTGSAAGVIGVLIWASYGPAQVLLMAGIIKGTAKKPAPLS